MISVVLVFEFGFQTLQFSRISGLVRRTSTARGEGRQGGRTRRSSPAYGPGCYYLIKCAAAIILNFFYNPHIIQKLETKKN